MFLVLIHGIMGVAKYLLSSHLMRYIGFPLLVLYAGLSVVSGSHDYYIEYVNDVG